MLCVQQAVRSRCLPEPSSWGGLGAAVLAVRPRQEEFPELARRPASMLNWTILQKLNAGQWFLKVWQHLSQS